MDKDHYLYTLPIGSLIPLHALGVIVPPGRTTYEILLPTRQFISSSGYQHTIASLQKVTILADSGESLHFWRLQTRQNRH